MNKLTLILAGLLIISTALLLQKEDIEILNADSQSIALADNTITIENNFKVTWHDCIYDLTESSCYVDIQNLLTTPNNGRIFNLSAVISNTNYDINSFNNEMSIYEWKAIPTEIPTYSIRLMNYTWQNITNNNITNETISNTTIIEYYNETYQNGTEIKNINQWKATKSNMLKIGTSAKMYYGSIIIPKYESKEKLDDNLDIETINGTKTFKIEWRTPINKLNDGGYGSSGKVAFWDEKSQTEYHPWWNTSWNYVRPITITNTSVLSDYQVNFVINSTYIPNLNWSSNGSDIRFTYVDNTTTLSYWIENWNTATSPNNASIWVKTNQSQINLWYGNPTATSQSNGTTTWDFFDDFSDGSCARWTVTAGNIDCSAGYLNTTTAADMSAYRSAAGFNSSQNITFLAKIYFPSAANTQNSIGIISPTTGYSSGLYNLVDKNQFGILNSSGWIYAYPKVTAPVTWISTKYTKFNNNISMTVNGSTFSNISASNYVWNYVVLFAGYTLKNYHYDDIAIGKYQFPEPTLSIGAEQTQVTYTLSGTVKDKNLAVVNGATVYIISQATNTTIATVITNSTGGWNYTVNTLGNYTIAAENRNNISQGGGINPHIVVS